ncbi:MAG: DUF4097 family beta strand repeat-containing protein [Caldilineaceae bacterium]
MNEEQQTIQQEQRADHPALVSAKAAEKIPSPPPDVGEWLKRLVATKSKQKVEERFDQQIAPAGLQQVAIQTTNGAIDYVGDSQEMIAVHAYKRVKAPDHATAEAFARQVAIHVEPQADTLRIYHTYPKPPRHVEVEVSFTVNGPRSMAVSGHSTNGQVAMRQVEGAVQAESTNGEIQLDAISGAVTARCTNGGVSAKRLAVTGASEFRSHNGTVNVTIHQGQAPITAATLNGSVHLALPPAYRGQLDARTQNGQVRSAFQMQITARSRTRLTGQIGGGGTDVLKLQSQNGNVTLAVASIA